MWCPEGGKVGKLICWSGTITWFEKILLPSWWQTLILVHLATKTQTRILKVLFVCLFRSAQYLFFDPSLMVKIVSFITNPILGFFRDCLWTFLWTAVWHRASVHEYFGSDVAAFFMGALVVLLCAFEVQFFFLSWKLNVLHLHFLK